MPEAPTLPCPACEAAAAEVRHWKRINHALLFFAVLFGVFIGVVAVGSAVGLGGAP